MMGARMACDMVLIPMKVLSADDGRTGDELYRVFSMEENRN